MQLSKFITAVFELKPTIQEPASGALPFGYTAVTGFRPFALLINYLDRSPATVLLPEYIQGIQTTAITEFVLFPLD